MKLFLTFLACGFVFSARAATDSAAALLRLLNSRASGSVKAYTEAAEDVADDARAGKILQQYVLAVLSREHDAPPAAQLEDDTREKYFAASRAAIRRLAEEKNNSLAWYLISLETGSTNALKRAAAGGNVQALNAWGNILISDALARAAARRDTNAPAAAFADAFACFKRAAGCGDANGLYNLGVCYARGLGTPRDTQNAFNCYRSAAEQGHPEAINNIGAAFREGRGVEKDLVRATRWFAKSAEYGNPFGMLNYGLALESGEGVTADVAQAVKLFKASAGGGCVEAMNVYGVALSKGRGVEKDEKEAAGWFFRAASVGYPPAMENLAACYDKGLGVVEDKRAAAVWKIRSRAARGDKHAQKWLKENGDERDRRN